MRDCGSVSTPSARFSGRRIDMKELLLAASFAALSAFCASALAAESDCPAPGPAPQAKGDPAEIHRLKVEINALNLINGLHLSAAQVQALLDGAREVKALKERHFPEKENDREAPSNAAELCMLLEKVKACYEKGEEPPAELLAELREKSGRGRKPAGDRPDPAEYGRRIREIEAKVCALLSESQKEVIADFKPCLVPPKNLRDPVRVGQAKSSEIQETFLEHTRRIPADRWAKLGRLIVEKALSKWEEKNGAIPEKKRAEEMEKAMAVIEKARALSDVDFQIEKTPLAEKITFIDRKEVVMKELEGLITRRIAPAGKVANVLLDPRIIPVLERRLELAKKAEKDPAVDLDGIEGADSCKGGKCGTPVKKD